jgi:hypothetical protein
MEVPLCVAIVVVGIFVTFAITLPTLKFRAVSALFAGLFLVVFYYGERNQVFKMVDCPLAKVFAVAEASTFAQTSFVCRG